MSTSSSSGSSHSPPTKYDVFLSFRGEDTRDTFISHLYDALCRKKIQTFIDDRLNKGEDISPSLLRNIEESMISVIVFSNNYASSKWCLDELTKILECKEKYGRIVVPVFYGIDPSNVRNQRGSFAAAFEKHDQNFKDNPERVRRWKASLTDAANLSGWDSMKIRPEAKLITEIVGYILKKLTPMSMSSIDSKRLVSIDKHIAPIKSLLKIESASVVRIVGIWGIGGIGKTTIAKALFHELATKFEFDSSVFIADVQEEVKRHGLSHVKNKYISNILEEDVESNRLSMGSNYLDRLQRVRVFLVLDNVNDLLDLKELIGGHDWFGPGSRIVLTTRDMQVLKNIHADETYEVKEMNFEDALTLFSLNAFHQKHPPDEYMELSKAVVDYAKGIPLALEVLGSSLLGREMNEWTSAMEKLAKAPDQKIFNVLKLSYDGLDDEAREIFLDIACFHRGQNINFVKQTLDSFGFSTDIGKSVLIDRGLIRIQNDEIVMHDLIQEMGQEIVHKESNNEPGKRSRLWKHDDVDLLLRRNTGTETVKCIYLNLCKIAEIDLKRNTFKKMHNLRLLQFYKSNPNDHSKVSINRGLKYLPNELRFLRWDEYPLKSLPRKFCPAHLVKIDFRDSRLEKLWEGHQILQNLKSIDLSGSKQLSTLPDLSLAPNVEEIILSYCIKLTEVYSSGVLNKLNNLWCEGCVELRTVRIYSTILFDPSGLMVLNNCLNLEKLVIGPRGIFMHATRSRYLYEPAMFMVTEDRYLYKPMSMRATRSRIANGICVDSVPYEFLNPLESMESAAFDKPRDNLHLLQLKLLREGLPLSYPCLMELCWLDLSNCESLQELPWNVFEDLPGLRKLYLHGCSMLKKLPRIKVPMVNLEVIILDESGITELPPLGNLHALEELSLRMCRMLKSIRSSIGSLSKLRKLDITHCESLEILPSSIFTLKLPKLDLTGCSMLEKLPRVLETNNDPSNSELAPKIRCLTLITELSLSGCSNILTLADDIFHLSSLKLLDLRGCRRLQSLPDLPPSLQKLLAFDCLSLKTLSRSRFTLSQDFEKNIFEFHLTNCRELDQEAHSIIEAEAQSRFMEDTYKSVFFCFPGSEVPNWFPYQGKGDKPCIEVPLDWGNGRFFGFAVCVVVNAQGKPLDKCRFRYSFRCRGESLSSEEICGDENIYYHNWRSRGRYLEQDQDHLLMWNFNLRNHDKFGDMNCFDSGVLNFDDRDALWVKVCGLWPLYTKEVVGRDDDIDEDNDRPRKVLRGGSSVKANVQRDQGHDLKRDRWPFEME